MAKQKKFSTDDFYMLVARLDVDLDNVRELQEAAEKDFDMGASLDQVAALCRYASVLMALSNSLMTDLRHAEKLARVSQKLGS